MRPSAHNLEVQSLATALATALWVQRFASERLHRAAPLPPPRLTIGQRGRAAGEFAETRVTGQVGIGLRTREFFERMIARLGRRRRVFLHRGDMRLVMKRHRPFHFSYSVGGPTLAPAAQSFLSRARLATPRESMTQKTIYSFVTLTLPFRVWMTTQTPALKERRLPPLMTLPASQPGPSLNVPVPVPGQGPQRENRVQIAPEFALAFTQIFRRKPVNSGASFKSEPRFWQNHAPFMESMPLSRPPVPQASWIGVSPSAPPPAERRPSWISTAAVTLPLPPVVVISSPVTLPRPAFVMLPEMVYGTRAFVTRPVFVTPSTMGSPAQYLPPTTPSRQGFAASSAHTSEETASPRKSFFQSATRLLAAAAALSLVQTLPALRLAAASSASNPSMASFASLTPQRTPLLVQHPRAAVGSSPLPRLRFYSSMPERLLPSRREPMRPHLSQTAFLSATHATVSPAISWEIPPPNLRMGVQITAAQSRHQHWPVRTASTKVDFANVLLRIHSPDLILLRPSEFTRKSGQKSDFPAQVPRILRAARKPKRMASVPLPLLSRGAVAQDIPRITPLLKHLDRLPFPRVGGERLPISESGRQTSFFSANLFTKPRRVPPLALTRRVSEPERVFLSSWPLPEGDAVPPFERIASDVPRQRFRLPVQVRTPIITRLRSGTSEIVAGKAFTGVAFSRKAFGKQAIKTAATKAQNRPSSVRIKALVRAGGPGEIAAANLMAQPQEQINRDLEEIVVEEFQPQLLTVVQNFLREVWNALSFAREGLEAVPAVPDSRSIIADVIGQAAITGIDTPPSVPRLRLIRTPTRQSFLREAPSHLIVGRQSDSVFAARMLPTAWPPVARNIPAAQRFLKNAERDLAERDLAETDLAERDLAETEETPKRQMGLPGLWPLPPTSRLPEGSRTHFPLGMTIAEARQTIAARREALAARNTPSSVGRVSMPTISPSLVRPLPMTLPAAAMPPSSEETWAIQRAASGEQSAAATLPEAHQQDVNLASQEKGAAANDVHLMANEVWSLLKRRLETEAERIGRR